jgi:hypothetical protein
MCCGQTKQEQDAQGRYQEGSCCDIRMHKEDIRKEVAVKDRLVAPLCVVW